MYMYRNACWCWCRGAGLLRLLPPTSVWPPLFLPLAHAHLRAATAGEVDAAEGSSRQGANPPLPLPVNTQQAKERPGPALFSTSNSSPAASSIIRSVPHTAPAPQLEVHTDLLPATCNNYVRTKPVRHTCVPRLSCVRHGPLR